MIGFISKLFGGNKSEKDVKQIEPLVGQINQYFASYQSISNDELRRKTVEFKERIKQHLAAIDAEIAKLKEDAEGKLLRRKAFSYWAEVFSDFLMRSSRALEASSTS